VKFWLAIAGLSYPGGAPAIASTLAKAAEAADDVGFIPA
jgi:hypothetical protein